MARLKLCAVFALVMGASCVAVAPAFAEFESAKKETGGSGENIELKFETGGGKIVCQAFTESSSKIAWTIKKEGKAASKGPELVSKIEKWGECSATFKGLEKPKVELGACEVEVEQPGSAREVSGTLVNTCTVKVASCEIKMEAKENKGLSAVELLSSGSGNENLAQELMLKKMKMTTAGECSAIGAGAKEGTFSGWIELRGVKAALAPEFSITTSLRNFTTIGQTATITIKNISAVAQVPNYASAFFPGNSFKTTGEANCKEKMYEKAGGGAASECSFTAEFRAVGFGLVKVSGASLDAAMVDLLG
jgi:hypothetical protein